MTSRTLRRDTRIGEGENSGRWSIVRKIGDGGFAEVFEVKDTRDHGKMLAVKMEKTDLPWGTGTVRQEYKILRKLQPCPHVCRLVEGGFFTHEGRSVIVMELLGMSLAQATRLALEGRWSWGVIRTVGLRLLDTLEGIHGCGFVHRDVKPGNFALFPSTSGVETGAWRAIDFGIARRYVGEDGSVLPSREEYNEFRGSTSYASVHAHRRRDLGRRDDLWSWFYMLVEMLDGQLPWRRSHGESGEKEAAKEAAAERKERCISFPDELVSNVPLPDGMRAISHHLAQLAFEDRPDYGLLRSCLEAAAESPMPYSAGLHQQLPDASTSHAGQPQMLRPGTYHSIPNTAYYGCSALSEGVLQPSVAPPTPFPGVTSPYLPPSVPPPQLHAPAALPPRLQPPPQQRPNEMPAKDTAMVGGCLEVSEIAAAASRGGLSKEASAVWESMRRLDPAEGIGVMAALLDEIGSRVDTRSREQISKWLADFAVFASFKAHDCQKGV